MKTPFFTAALLALALTPALRADLIELTDGRKITGTLSRAGDVITIKADDGKIITAKPAEIAKVTLTTTLTPEEAAAAEWSRIPSLVKSAEDLQIVLDLYNNFLTRFPTAKQADEARSTLAIYHTMVDNDPVNFRGRWMPRAQVGVQIKLWSQTARPALELYQAGRLKETLDALAPILKADPLNPDAQTLGGLAAYRLNNLPLARTYFSNLAAADPSSVLAENNLAVVSVGQKQPGEAFIHYTRALAIMPDQRLLLDNTIEFAAAYLAAGGDKNSAAYRALDKAFQPAEARMQETMAKAGKVRWGSTWITRQQKDHFQQISDSLQTQLPRLDAQQTSIRNTLAGIQNKIHQAQIDADNFLQIINSANIQIGLQPIPLDTSFFAVQRAAAQANYANALNYQAQLQAEYDQVLAASGDFLAQVDTLKAAVASGKLLSQFNGTQHIIDWDQTDNPPAPAPVTEPNLPALTTPGIIIVPPASPTPPALLPIPTQPVLLPTPQPNPQPLPQPLPQPNPQPQPKPPSTSQPSSQPSTQPISQPTTQPATQPAPDPSTSPPRPGRGG